MTHKPITKAGLLGLLLAGVAIPAAAQETVSPPTLTAPSTAPQPEVAPAPAASPGVTFAPQAPVVQTAPPPAPPPESVRNPALEPGARTARRAVARAAPVARPAPVTRAPVAAAPVAPAPAVAETAPAAAPSPEITPAPAAEPVAEAAPAQPAANGEVSSFAAWGLLGLVGVAILGLIAFLVARRRRRAEDEFVYDEVYEEPVAAAPLAGPAYVEPAPIAAAPAAVAPAMVDENAGRPWIDIGLRPVRADESLQVEVTVSNSGDAPAHDVRVSTWMLNGESTAGEQALIDARSDAQTATINVASGADESVDSVLALPHTGTPILVAEARYPLPQGGEGRIAATFEIETNGDPDHVEARLHEVIERA